MVKVEKGNPTPEQVAMITAIIAAKAAGGGPAVPPTRDEWGRPVDRLRPHWASATSFCTQPLTGGPEVVLGSASPARLRVLRQAGLEPRVLIADLDEDALVAELAAAPPTEIVTRLAAAKADALIACRLPDAVLLTCDSMLRIRGELVGKPHTPR